MTRFKLIGAAAFLSLLSATPALAQRMVDEPGAFAFTIRWAISHCSPRPAG